ncbi:hypothetical protein RF11_12578 [Thelohanellus kitauei]|uniref:Uncharacterized protein n=1 Tax=Thelohanellus kitauei TaxID=669202 RepID=A0A0C2N4Y2_THEKT|nr:hypothetical protein RF11_12578 [Thelohanellus kitauei]
MAIRITSPTGWNLYVKQLNIVFEPEIKNPFLSVSDLGDAGHLAFFKAQDHRFNELHFYGNFMVAFEQLLSNGIHECVFIVDNVRFYKNQSGPDHAAREWPHGNIPSTLLAFPPPIEKFIL